MTSPRRSGRRLPHGLLANLVPPVLGFALLLGSLISYHEKALPVTLVGQGRPVSVLVGLGDSVPAGTACSCRDYIELIARAQSAAQRHRVMTHNLAEDGQTSSGLLQQLQRRSVVRALRRADLTVVTVGANDFDSSAATRPDCSPDAGLSCYRAALARLRANLTAIVARISRIQGPGRRHELVLTGYWNVFLDGAVGRSRGPDYVRTSDALTRAVNQTIAQAATGAPVRYVDLYTPFKGSGDADDTPLLANDGDHPSAAGHTLIARAVWAAIDAG